MDIVDIVQKALGNVGWQKEFIAYLLAKAIGAFFGEFGSAFGMGLISFLECFLPRD